MTSLGELVTAVQQQARLWCNLQRDVHDLQQDVHNLRKESERLSQQQIELQDRLLLLGDTVREHVGGQYGPVV